MGAQYYIFKTQCNPIDYCFLSLQCNFLSVHKKDDEYKLLFSYGNGTNTPGDGFTPDNVDIYRAYRKGEKQRFEENNYHLSKNRMLLCMVVI